MRLVFGDTIKRALREIMPTNIAVAYVGADWRSYIDASALKEIVLSPTLGSNPFAIAEIAGLLGWDNVHFLDNLHAKIYWAATSAAVGSFNLTANGLSGVGLEEAGYVVQEATAIEQLRTLLEQYKSQAHTDYPSKKSKLERLATLRALWDRAATNEVIRNDAKETEFEDYRPIVADEMYVCPISGDCSLTEAVLSPKTLNNYVNLLASDKVDPDRWILCWYANDEGYPNEDGEPPYWVHIDDVIAHGSADEPYTTLMVERKRKNRLIPPFEITERFAQALYAVLRSGQFQAFLLEADPWSLSATISQLPAFLEAIRTELAKSSKSEVAQSQDIDSLRKAFAERVRASMDIAVGHGYVTGLIERMLASQHAVEVAKKLVRSSEIKKGLLKLVKAGHPELSFESMVLDEQFEPLFSQDDRACAEFNLREARVELGLEAI